MLRFVRLAGEIVAAPFRGNRAVVESALITGFGLGFAGSAFAHSSVPEGLFALAAFAWAGLRFVEALESTPKRDSERSPSAVGHLVALAVVGVVLTARVEAQEIEQAEAIRDAANAARDAQMEEAQAFADRVLDLARQHREAADAVGETTGRLQEGMPAVSEMFDLEDFDPAEFGLTPQEGPVLYVLVSLGMPDDALRRLAMEAHELNATMVIRGFYGETFLDTQNRIASLFSQDEAAGLTIDPRPFKAFGVTQVPAIVYAEGPIEPCGELGCVPAAPPHDIVRGNISLRAALELFGRD
ncbi:type-F conjugative transfer system pilin assembly protein TrbC [Hyphomonas sp.]|uniref:type-F conjugative transfer system pilin assembly protein TrbC n=1 Tax=Hyphomonas sp. TaxID=87 RepID=UPI00260BF36A|nr:type-F conjugative transfer system pilin assembly protein TrbC [Hyphomonas sp.]MDF1805791.1 type-F conjugative transfer system pilin assembly protein TrbC [Hyphomonas sp.]